MGRIVLVLALICAPFAAPHPARADEFDLIQARQQVIAQKWKGEVQAALDASRRLERTDPQAAKDSLNAVLDQVRAAPGLNDALRQDLSRRLQSRIQDVVVAVRPQPVKQPAPIPARPVFTPSAPPPGGISDTARSFIDQQRALLGKSNEARKEHNAGITGVFSGIQDSAVPTTDPLTFSPRHKDIVARRQPQINPKEEAVMRALGSVMSVDFTGMNFRQVIEFLGEKTGITIVPDGNSMKEAMVEYDDPVSFKVSGRLTVRSVLRKLLGDRGLSYTVQDGIIHVVTIQRAREYTTVRVYPINDLVTPISPQPQVVFNPVYGWVPVQQGAYELQMGQTVADLVKGSVDPSYWQPQGPGSITFSQATGALIVRASAEVHYLVHNALYRR